MRISKKLKRYPWLFEPEEAVQKEKYLSIQEVVDMSNFYLKLHSAILYGLIEGELPNQERCLHYLELGKRHGVSPDDNFIPDEFLLTLNP